MPPKRESIYRSTPEARKKRALRASETKEKRARRLEAERLRTAQARLNETEEQRKLRLEANRIRIAQVRSNETEEQRKSRLEANRVRLAQIRSNKTSDQRKTRLQTNRERNIRSRRTMHSDLNLAAFHYDYSLHRNVVIGKMDKLCDFNPAINKKFSEIAATCDGRTIEPDDEDELDTKRNPKKIKSEGCPLHSELATAIATQGKSTQIEQIHIKEEPLETNPNDGRLYQQLRNSVKNESDNSETETNNSISIKEEPIVNVKKECSDSDNEISVNHDVKTEQTPMFESVYVKEEPLEENFPP